MRIVLKIRKKGIIILPKKLREVIGFEEGGEVVAEVIGDKLVLRPLKPRIVDIDPKLVEEILNKEYRLEEKRYTRMISSE